MGESGRCLATLDEAQSNLELDINDSKELENDIEYTNKFQHEVKSPRILVTRRLVDISKDDELSTRPSDSSSMDLSCNVNVRLPKLELPKFSD